VLVGLTYLDVDGQIASQHEVHGRVKSALRTSAIVLDRTGQADSGEFRLPPDTSVFGPAAPGEYRLRSTGEVVTNPDAVATWTVSKSSDG
jgi:hypothetical protein